jgi:hypothetical protein
MGMPLKFQFQFAGVDFNRPSSPWRKRVRIGLAALAAVLAAATYWFYLHHLTHRAQPVAHAAPLAAPAKPAVPPVPAKANPAAAAAPTIASTLTGPIAAAKKVAEAEKPRVAAVSTVLADAAEHIANIAKPKAPTPGITIITGPVTRPVAKTANRPATPMPMRVQSDAEKLALAGATAFANVVELADKFPDSYGFQVNDFLSTAKLGAPMQVYTIDESSRAAYQHGAAIKPLLKPANEWVFPVQMGDRLCCFVEVKRTGHDYEPGKGNKSLAMAWKKITEKWPTEAGYHPLLVMNPDVPGYYFTVPELPEQNMTDTSEMFYLHPNTSPADVILASWR